MYIISHLLLEKLISLDLTKSDLELYFFLASLYSDGKIFTINKEIKRLLVEKTGKEPSAYNNSTKKLLEAELIVETKTKRVYMLNIILLHPIK